MVVDENERISWDKLLEMVDNSDIAKNHPLNPIIGKDNIMVHNHANSTFPANINNNNNNNANNPN